MASEDVIDRLIAAESLKIMSEETPIFRAFSKHDRTFPAPLKR
jgi:hypothetical protein